MHRSSFDKMRALRDAYLLPFRAAPLVVLDVGSAAVTADAGTYRTLFEPPWRYIGLDLSPGHNVDVVVADPYAWTEIPDASVDVVLSGQAFEHIAWPWLTICEIARVLRPFGLAAITAPSAGHVHRFPLDCWRYYPDGLPALAAFANLTVLEAHMDQSYAFPECALWGDSFVLLQRMAAGAAPSLIGPQTGRAALDAHQRETLATLSPVRLKAALLWQLARRAYTILRTPVRDLTPRP